MLGKCSTIEQHPRHHQFLRQCMVLRGHFVSSSLVWFGVAMGVDAGRFFTQDFQMWGLPSVFSMEHESFQQHFYFSSLQPLCVGGL